MSRVAIAAGDGGGREDGRGRLAGKTPAAVVKSAVDAGLPAELGAAVLAVTGKTRLWNRERTDVARELCGHFLCGLEEGEMPSVLLGSFGDAKHAARLITRAKKRNRPWAWRAMKRSVQAAGALLALTLVWYGWQAARFYSGSPTIKINVQAEMNAASVVVPVEQRGWPLYRDAARELAHELASGGVRNAEGSLAMLEGWPRLKPGTSQWQAACSILDQHRSAVGMIRRAASMERSAYVISQLDLSSPIPAGAPDGEVDFPQQNPVGWSVLLPNLGVYRSLARVLVFDAERAAAEGRHADVAADIRAMIAMGRHAREDGTVIAQLVSIAIDALAVETAGEMVRDHASLFSEDELVLLAHDVGSCRGGGGPGSELVDLTIEKRNVDDLLQRFFTDDGSGDGRLCKGMTDYDSAFGMPTREGGAFVRPLIAAVAVGRKETGDLVRQMIAEAEAIDARPLYQRDWSGFDRKLEEMRRGGLGVRYSLAAILVPALVHPQKSLDILLTERDGVAAGLAAELFNRRNGHYPSGWDEIVPRFLPTPPLDRWSGHPLRYKAGAAPGDRPLIYSVGADKTDDDGVIGTPWFAFNAAVTPVYPALTGDIPTKDWVIWPPVEDVGVGPPGKVKQSAPTSGYKWGWIGALMGEN